MIHISKVLIRQLTYQNRVTVYICVRNVYRNIWIAGSFKASLSDSGLSRCCSNVSNLLHLNVSHNQVRIIQQPCCVDEQVVRRLHGQGLSLRIVCHNNILHAIHSVTGEVTIINPNQVTCLTKVLASGEGYFICCGIQSTLNPSIWQVF